jgi:hypothetical protein
LTRRTAFVADLVPRLARRSERRVVGLVARRVAAGGERLRNGYGGDVRSGVVGVPAVGPLAGVAGRAGVAVSVLVTDDGTGGDVVLSVGALVEVAMAAADDGGARRWTR